MMIGKWVGATFLSCVHAIPLLSQEVLVEFCADQRFHEDTLFFVVEEDYRFWPKGEDPDRCDDYDERLTKCRLGSIWSQPPSASQCARG